MTTKFPRRSANRPMQVAMFDEIVSRMPGDSAAADMRSALTAVTSDYRAILDACERIGKDRTLTDGGRLVRQAKVARTKVDEAIGRIAAAKVKLSDYQAHLSRELEKPFNYQDARFVDVQLASEIRSYFRGADNETRLNMLTTALANGDRTMVKAIGGAPAYLSGLHSSPTEKTADGTKIATPYSMVRDAVFEATAPGAVAQMAIVAETLKAADMVESTLMQSCADLIDFVTADTIAATADAA